MKNDENESRNTARATRGPDEDDFADVEPQIYEVFKDRGWIMPTTETEVKKAEEAYLREENIRRLMYAQLQQAQTTIMQVLSAGGEQRSALYELGVNISNCIAIVEAEGDSHVARGAKRENDELSVEALLKEAQEIHELLPDPEPGVDALKRWLS